MNRVKPKGRLAELSRLRTKKGVLLPKLQEVILAQADDDDGRRQDVIHVSEMAKADWCPLATYYRIAGWKIPTESYNVVLENIFEEGNDIQMRWNRRMQATGDLWGWWRCQMCHEWKVCTSANLDKIADEDWVMPDNPEGIREDYCSVFGGEPGVHMWEYKEVPMDVEDTHLIVAHADGADWALNVLTEVKSIGMGTLRLDAPKLLSKHYHKLEDQDKKIYDLDGIWKGLVAPLPSHLRQGMLYLWMAKEIGLPFDRMSFLYEFKSNQMTKEFVVSLVQDIVDPLLYAAKTIKDALDDVNCAPPECPFGGCKYCKEIEELNADKEPAGRRADAAPGRRQPESIGGSAGAGSDAGEVVAEAISGMPRRALRHHRADGRGADGTVPAVQAVGELPDLADSSSGGRRILRRSSDHQD